MSFKFSGASSQYLSTAATTLSAPPLTISAWVYQATLSTGVIASASPASGVYVGIASLSTGPVRIVTPLRDLDTTVNALPGRWNHVCGVYESTANRSIYLNAAGNTDTVDIGSPISSLSVLVGARRLSGLVGVYYTGFIAEVGIWNINLSQSEIHALASGVANKEIRPQNLVFNAPLVRDIRDVQSNLVLTNNNAATIAQDHPQIYRAKPKKRVFRGVTFAPPTGARRRRILTSMP